jgi:hypothetical protein
MIPRSNLSPLYRNHSYKESVQRDRLQMTPSESWPHMFRLKITTYEALALPSLSSRTELQNSHDWHTLQRHPYTLFLQIQHTEKRTSRPLSRGTRQFRTSRTHSSKTHSETTARPEHVRRVHSHGARGPASTENRYPSFQDIADAAIWSGVRRWRSAPMCYGHDRGGYSASLIQAFGLPMYSTPASGDTL